MKSNYKRLGDYIASVKARNTDLRVKDLLGININKHFMPSVANIVGTDLSNYKLVNYNQFACNRMHVGRDYRIPIAISKNEETFMVSPAYDVFEIKNKKELLPDYLMMWFERSEFDRNAWFYTDADVRGGLAWQAFENMQLPIPHPDKQREIVKEYNTIQNRITINQQLIQKLEETAQAIYREWFVEGIDLDNLPVGWRVGKLSDIATIIMGQSPEGESYNEGCEGVALINGPVEFGEYFTVKTKWTTEPKKYCEKGDLIFCVRGSTVGKNVIADDKYAIGRGVCAIRSKYQNHLIQLVKCNLNEILKDVTGSTFPNIDRVTLSDYPIAISTNTLLEKFDKKVSHIANLVWVKSLENQKLTELKALLLSRMATLV
jgi:type I restriction enzyme S subunit